MFSGSLLLTCWVVRHQVLARGCFKDHSCNKRGSTQYEAGRARYAVGNQSLLLLGAASQHGHVHAETLPDSGSVLGSWCSGVKAYACML